MSSNEMCHHVTYITVSVAAEINDIGITIAWLTGLSRLWVSFSCQLYQLEISEMSQCCIVLEPLWVWSKPTMVHSHWVELLSANSKHSVHLNYTFTVQNTVDRQSLKSAFQSNVKLPATWRGCGESNKTHQMNFPILFTTNNIYCTCCSHGFS